MSYNAERTYQGEPAATALVSYLNGKDQEGKAGRTRVTRIIETFHEILRLLDKYPPSQWKGYRSIKPKELGLLEIPAGLGDDLRRKPNELATIENSLLEQVARYERTLVFGIGSNRECDFSWGLAVSKDLDWENEEWGITSESAAVDAIVELSRERLLPRVQRCECGKWFFAKFSHQQFCSPRCRSRHQRKSPEFKAYRRKYMRDYYQLQKKNVK